VGAAHGRGSGGHVELGETPARCRPVQPPLPRHAADPPLPLARLRSRGQARRGGVVPAGGADLRHDDEVLARQSRSLTSGVRAVVVEAVDNCRRRAAYQALARSCVRPRCRQVWILSELRAAELRFTPTESPARVHPGSPNGSAGCARTPAQHPPTVRPDQRSPSPAPTPSNMFPLTSAATLPNIGRTWTPGSSGTRPGTAPDRRRSAEGPASSTSSSLGRGLTLSRRI
jgi:hypothetical protein